MNPNSYTCPMHPEVVASKPGSCPKCGMGLTTIVAQPSQEPDSELGDMSRRFWVSLILTIPFVILKLFFEPSSVRQVWFQWVLATPIVVWGGKPFFIRAFQSLKQRSLNMFTLIAMGTGTAYLYSMVVTLFPALLPIAISGGGAFVYFDAAAMITTLVLLGQVLELRARRKTQGAIQALIALAPKTARHIKDDGQEEDIAVEHIQVGAKLRVFPGEKLAVDGVVLEGESAVDESLLTGESIPIHKKVNDWLIGGTLNTSGSMIMRVERVGEDTLLSQIVRMVTHAQRTRAPIQRTADRVAAFFVPGVIIVACLTFLAWLFLGPEPRIAHAIMNSVAVLIVACPCALGLATPMSIMVATGRGAHAGILIKKAEALEVLSRVNTLVIDKTGTLTEGKPQFQLSLSASRFSADELLRLAASLEQGSEHPIGTAIVAGAQSRGLEISQVSGFQSIAGEGVRGQVDTHQVVVGNRKIMEDENISLENLSASVESLRREGQTVVFVAVDGRAAGVVAISDPIKKTAGSALRLLQSEGVRVVMVTGDHRITAEAVAKHLLLDEVIAEVLPAEKGRIIRELEKDGRIVAMAGDGVNDAPALAQAHVGIAMGTGTDVAMESAGIILVKGDLMGLVRARRLSQATLRNIRQNLFFAFVYNMLGVPLAAGVLYPFFGLLLSPVFAGAAMSLSSVSVIANALRLRRLNVSI